MVSVLLLMAGKGTRMGYEKNKILLPFGDKYLFEYPLDTFLSFGFEVICVISKEDEEEVSKVLNKKNVKYTLGGKTRGESVYNGLKVANGDYIMIHDAARMFIDKDLINEILATSLEEAPILTYTKVKDTIKALEDKKLNTLNRDSLIAAATPQCAKRSLFLDVYEKAFKDGYSGTDDISLIEKYYKDMEIKLVLAKDTIFKVTTKLDYDLALLLWREIYD
jgi:2-C-methyl-D-erythritol 4-phosphate cytidylyltransferase